MTMAAGGPGRVGAEAQSADTWHLVLLLKLLFFTQVESRKVSGLASLKPCLGVAR